jgi:CheY-like chemotaxis protein
MRTINVVNFRIDEKKQNLIINVAIDVPPYIVSDEQRLSQVIANLLSNAVKFTPEQGSITLTARLLGEEDGLCTLLMEVRDTGIGITEEQQAKLFHSFEQADGSISRKFGGTGLGLAISKSIIQLMGGDIWVKSTIGQGATFAFSIKARRGAKTPQNLPVQTTNWKTLRVLFVDDAPEVQEYFRSFASSIGLDHEIASSGAEACGLLASTGKEFNLVFTDWEVSDMDGLELARRIKREYSTCTVVIMLSVAHWSEIEQEAKRAGVDRCITKPLFSSYIVDCINACLGCQQPAALEIQKETDWAGCFAGKRVLLVDDVAINREIIISLLEHTGIAFDSAQDGREAFEMFQHSPSAYAGILMDIHMPEVDGYEATRRIRDLGFPEARAVPIIAMTANVFREDIEKCLAAGMDDHVGKPIDLEQVMEKLRKYLL